MSEVRGRVQWVDAARGLAIALVVLHHAAKRSAVVGSADWWLDVTGMLSTVRMPLFFTVAGLFAAKWVSDQMTWPSMLRAKVLLFAWVYAVWVVLRHVWFIVLPPIEKETLPPPEVALRLVWPAGGWFIFTLALMYIVAKAVQAVAPPLVLAAASVVSVVFLADWIRFGNLAWDGVGKYTVFFLLGIALRRHILQLSETIPAKAATGVPVAWAGIYLAFAAAGLEDAPVIGFLLRLAGIAAGVAVALLLQRWEGLRALGRNTLPVYLAHQLLVVTAVSGLGSIYAFDRNAVLEHGAPLIFGVSLILVTHRFGLVAPRIGLGWLFATPRWVEKLTGLLDLERPRSRKHRRQAGLGA